MSLVSEQQARTLLTGVVAKFTPNEGEAILSGGHCTVARFAGNRFHQNVGENRYQILIRLVSGKRTVAVSTEDFSDAALDRLVEGARQMLPLVSETENLLPLLGPQKYRISQGRYDASFGALDLEASMEAFGRFFERCDRAGFICAGKLERVQGTIGDYGELSPLAMANTSGLFAYSPATAYDFSTTVYRDQCSGWAGNSARRWNHLDLPTMMDRALDKARASLSPQPLTAGRYTVILEPPAVTTLVGHIAEAFNAQSVLEKRSVLTDAVGKTVFPKWFDLDEDPYNDFLGGAPFDGEGVPVESVKLVERGTVRSFVTTRALAKKMGLPATGHGRSIPNPYGAFARSLHLKGDSGTLEDLIKSTQRAILVTRLWYTTPVDEKQMIVSGMTRDGTFLVENGAVVGSLSNLRFNENLISMFGRVEAMTKTQSCFGALVPAMRIADFNFTSSTEF